MTFVNEDTVRFRYRIAGLEERWSETRLREAHLRDLPAGQLPPRSAGQRRAGSVGPGDGAPGFHHPAGLVAHLVVRRGALAAAAFLAAQWWAFRLRGILRRQKELETAVADRTAHLERQKQEIERLFVESQQAARLKEEFLANMNHELRTPMNGIIGMTELALDTSLTEEQQEYLETVRSSSSSLLGIIDDILDFSNIEAGKLDLQAVVFDPREVTNRAVRDLAPRARQKNLEMRSQIESSVPHRLGGRPVSLAPGVDQPVEQLGQIHRAGTGDGEAVGGGGRPEDALLHFEVADTGVGDLPGETIPDLRAFLPGG